jgi:alanine dehydrogenase
MFAMNPKQGLLFLNEATLRDLIDPSELLQELTKGFMALCRGEISVPDRTKLSVSEKDLLLCMPACQPDARIAVKMVTIFPGNANLVSPTHHALICLFNPSSGAPICVMDGTYITALRTALAAILSVRLLATKSSRVAVVIGSGVQAREHVRLLSLARDFEELLVWSRNHENAFRLAEELPSARAVLDLETNVSVADVVCLCTSSQTPIIQSEWMKPGAHITSVGFAPPGGELPRGLTHQLLFVETRQAFKPPPVGCSELADIDPQNAAELGEVLLGLRPGRSSSSEITVYKAMGFAMEDLVAANLAYRCALLNGHGEYVSW